MSDTTVCHNCLSRGQWEVDNFCSTDCEAEYQGDRVTQLQATNEAQCARIEILAAEKYGLQQQVDRLKRVIAKAKAEVDRCIK